MRRRIVHSKKGLSTMSWTIERKKSHLAWNQVPSQHEQHLPKQSVNLKNLAGNDNNHVFTLKNQV